MTCIIERKDTGVVLVCLSVRHPSVYPSVRPSRTSACSKTVGRIPNRQTSIPADTQPTRETKRTDWQEDKQTDRQTDRQTHRRRGRPTDRQPKRRLLDLQASLLNYHGCCFGLSVRPSVRPVRLSHTSRYTRTEDRQQTEWWQERQLDKRTLRQ